MTTELSVGVYLSKPVVDELHERICLLKKKHPDMTTGGILDTEVRRIETVNDMIERLIEFALGEDWI